MATTKTGWKTVKKGVRSGELAHYKETFMFGTGTTDAWGSEFGQAISAANFPPPGVDFTVMFIQNNTMSTAGDIVLYGAEKSGGTFALLKDDLVAYAASAAGGSATSARYNVGQFISSPTGPETEVYKFLIDGDGAHSASTGTDKTAEIHVLFIQP